jgi:hypothetical protein
MQTLQISFGASSATSRTPESSRIVSAGDISSFAPFAW